MALESTSFAFQGMMGTQVIPLSGIVPTGASGQLGSEEPDMPEVCALKLRPLGEIGWTIAPAL